MVGSSWPPRQAATIGVAVSWRRDDRRERAYRSVIRAVVFDIGGVLEKVADPGHTIVSKWRAGLRMSEAQFRSAMAAVDPGNLAVIGRMSEAEYAQRSAAALGLSPAQAREFMADMWDWYCGTLDTELTAFAAALRPQFATAILSNSADGARREEEARYGFGAMFDTIVYSHAPRRPSPRSGR